MAFDPKHKDTKPPANEHKKPDSPEEPTTNDKISQNPNPRANENLKDKKLKPGNTNQVGSEITDGEAG